MTTNDSKNPWEEDKNSGNANSSGRGQNKQKVNKNDDFDEMIRKGQKRLIDLLGGGQHSTKKNNVFSSGGGGGMFNSSPSGLPAKKIILVLIILVLGAWFSTGFYTVQPDEQGVVMRFGKYSRISGPGLNYKIPTPFEKVIIKSVTRVNKEEIGFRSAMRDSDRRGKSRQSIPQESQMLTGDENIIDIDFDVQWVVKDVKQYLFNVRDLIKENTVKNAAESSMREVMGQVGIADALAEERSNIEFKAKTLLQEILDSYGMGIQVLRLQMLRVEPPPEVLGAYRDVQSAKADRESVINDAYKHRNGVVPNARGYAEALLQEAEGYKRERIEIATGKAGRFNKIYSQYVSAKEVTRKRMYLETLEEIFSGMSKIILDSNASNSGVLPYLPLDQLRSPSKNSKAKKGFDSSESFSNASYGEEASMQQNNN